MKAFAVVVRDVRLFVREWGEVDRPAVLYWDGLGGCELHANEIAPILARGYGLRLIAPDAQATAARPSCHWRRIDLRLSRLWPLIFAAPLGLLRAAFVGFSWERKSAAPSLHPSHNRQPDWIVSSWLRE